MRARQGLFLGAVVWAGVSLSTSGAAAQTTTLYNQTGNSPSGYTSEDFESVYDAYDNAIADDFTVPSDTEWQVQVVHAQVVLNGNPLSSTAHVDIYEDDNGTPGCRRCVYTNLPVSATPVDGRYDWSIPLPTSCDLGPGTYWVSVRGVVTYDGAGQRVFWAITSDAPRGNAGRFKNPGNGFGTGCTSFTPMSTCFGDANAQEVIFGLDGTSGPYVPVPSVDTTTTFVPGYPSATVAPFDSTAIQVQVQADGSPLVGECSGGVTFELQKGETSLFLDPDTLASNGIFESTWTPDNSLTGIWTLTARYEGSEGYNPSQVVTTVEVIPNQPPVLSLPSNMVLEGNTLGGRVVTFSASATDESGSVPVTCSHSSGQLFPVGVTTVSCSASDPLGQVTNGSFTITITDTRPPLVSITIPKTVYTSNPGGAVVNYTVRATDVVSGNLTATCTPYASGSMFPVGRTTLVCRATDAVGRTGSASALVTVTLTTAN
ncbi:MAG: HYR domain-containing protein [Myxococcota bacterium]